MDNAFEASSGSQEVSKDTVRRLCVWLQPIRVAPKISKTERVCFNARSDTSKQGIGTPAVFFPCASKSTWNDFLSPSFEGLKKRVFVKRRFPVALLELLSGNKLNSEQSTD